jgi:hypothetical protein
MRADGTTKDCPKNFIHALLSTAALTSTALNESVDFDELVASLEAKNEIMDRVNADLEERLNAKLERVFEIIEAELASDGTVSSIFGFELFPKIRAAVKKASEKLEEIRDEVEEKIGCGI